MVSVGPVGKVQRLMWPQNHPFVSSSSAACPRLAAPFLSFDFLVLCSRLWTSCLRLAIMLPTSFASKPNSSPQLGMEVLRLNTAAIRSTLPSPEEGSSLGRASVLVLGMGEVLSLKFCGKSSGKWYVHFSCLLIVANARGLQGGL